MPLLTLDDLADLAPPTEAYTIPSLGKTVQIKVLSILATQVMLARRKDWGVAESPPEGSDEDTQIAHGINGMRWAICEGLATPAFTRETVDTLLSKIPKADAQALMDAILVANGLKTKQNASGEAVNEVAAATADAFPAQPA